MYQMVGIQGMTNAQTTFAIGDIVAHKLEPMLRLSVEKIRYSEPDDESTDPPYIQDIEFESEYSGERYGFSADLHSFDWMIRADASLPKIETNTWNVTKQRMADVRGFAEKDFANHQMTIQADCPDASTTLRRWRFRRPNDSAYWFDVIAWPGGFVVNGDIGTCVWDRYGIEWAIGAIDSIDYFAKKTPQELPVKEWDKDVATAYVWEEYFKRAEELLLNSEPNIVAKSKYEPSELESLQETRDKLLSIMDDSGEHGFNHYLYHETNWVDGCDFPDNETFTNSFLWCREALKVAFKHMGWEKQK